MKILTRFIIPLLLCSCIYSDTHAKSKKTKQENTSKANQPTKQSTIPPSCGPCTSLICSGSSGATGISGCTGPNCSGCTGGSLATFCCLSATTTINVVGQTTIAQKNVIGNVAVGLSADIKDDLTVSETTDLQGNVCMEGNLNVGQNLSVAGLAVVLGSLQVGNGATVSGNLQENGNVTVNGSLLATGNKQMTGTLSVGGNATFSGLLTASGGLSVYNGEIINSGGLTIVCSGASGATGATGISGISGCSGAQINGDICITGDEIINGDLFISDSLTVDELATFNGNVTIGTSGPTGSNSALITNSSVIMNDGLTIAGGDEIINAGSLTIASGTLMVGGASTFLQPITTNDGVIIQGGLTVNGGQNINLGNLDVTIGSAFISGGLTVNGSISSSTGISSFDSLTLTDTLNSLCPSGPATLVVDGGVGVAKDLWLGGAEYFAQVATQGGTPTALDYYEESCFSSAFIWGGQTVNPATSVQVKIVRVGDIVNLLIPAFIISNPGTHIDVVSSASPLPARFRPFTTIRGAAATIVSNAPTSATTSMVTGALGEFDVAPSGTITFGLPGLNNAIGPQTISSVNYVAVDYNTITYQLGGCSTTCKMPCT